MPQQLLQSASELAAPYPAEGRGVFFFVLRSEEVDAEVLASRHASIAERAAKKNFAAQGREFESFAHVLTTEKDEDGKAAAVFVAISTVTH